MSVPRVGQVVQATGEDGRVTIGTVFMDITERTLVLETPAGTSVAVKVKGTTWAVHGEDDVPLPPEPEDDGQ